MPMLDTMSDRLNARRRESVDRPREPSGFTPKLITVLREGYGADRFRADALAGLTVAIVALPLAMALGVASGASPDKGDRGGTLHFNAWRFARPDRRADWRVRRRRLQRDRGPWL
jgi:hypothetical protein